MGDWMSWIDGADSNRAVKARNEAITEVAWLGVGTGGASLVLGAIEGYNRAKDPAGGMPNLVGPLDLDAIVGIGGVVGAIWLGDALGEKGQLISLGAGLAGLGSVASHWGRVWGAKMYAPVATRGHHVGALQERSQLNPDAQSVYDEFMKAA
jgi:hypothetical protein